MKRYLSLFILLTVIACQKQADTGDNTNEPVTMLNVSYAGDAKQTMDIYLPAGRNSDTEGDKADFSSYVPVIQNLLPGYAIFNVNYRLASGSNNLFPAQENDIKSAVDFIYSKRSSYHISDKFVYLGASAGGHLALLQAYKYDTPVKPKAVISFFGPTDLTALFNTNVFAGIILAQVTGNTPTGNPSLYEQSSPLTFVNASSPPTLLFHGGLDPLVPPAQSETLENSLTNAGVSSQYVFYPNETHGWEGPNLDDSFDKIAAFLHTYVN